MNKNILIISTLGIALIAIVAGGMFFLNQQNNKDAKMAMEKAAMMQGDESDSEESMMNEDHAMMQKDDASMSDEEKMMDKSENSGYIEYSKANLDNTAENKRLLFFYASWCPICRPVDTALKNNSNLIPDGVSVIRVNFNDPDTDQEEKDLAKKYNVTYQHTFVQIDENGNQVNKWSGGEIKEILSNLK